MASSLTVNQRAPSRFLDLPGEVRNRIYYHAFGNAIIQTDQASIIHRAPPKPEWWPFIGLVLSCKQIHHEASSILYRHGHLHIYAGLFHLCIKHFDLTFRLDERYERHLEQIENLHVDIGWRSHTGTQQALLPAIDKLGHVKTITIKWPFLDSWRPAPKHSFVKNELLRLLLRPFVRLQAKSPEMKIEVETGLKGHGLEAGLKSSWDTTMGLEEYMAKKELVVDPGTQQGQGGDLFVRLGFEPFFVTMGQLAWGACPRSFIE